jgi:Ca2+-binding EF-hand superfamily protein
MSEATVGVWRTVFRAFDRDGSGRVDRAELSRALRNLGDAWTDERIAAELDKYDADGRNALTFDQFLQLVTGGPALVDPELVRAFRAMDLNGDGAITPDELKSLFDLAGVNAQAEIDAFILEGDLDGDGQIDFGEFLKLATAT